MAEHAQGLRGNPLVDRTTVLRSWRDIVEAEDSFGPTWMFRGHSDDWPLISTLHRACGRFGTDYTLARSIEYALMRDFRRSYDGVDYLKVKDDAMYCLAKMQHHGAPTRLIDWTYSFFIALYFAMEGASAGKDAFIWAFDYDWVTQRQKATGLSNWEIRNVDETRGKDDLFEQEYFVQRNRMVFVESALPLNSRIADQQGVFLLPGIIGETVDAIMNAILDRAGVLKIYALRLNNTEFANVINKLHRMRLTHRSVYADASWFGRDLVLKIPALCIRNERIMRGEFIRK